MAYTQDIDIFVKQLDGLASKRIAVRAREVRNDMEQDGASLAGVRAVSQAIVDGVPDAPLEEVKPDGVIRLEFDYRIAIVEDLLLEMKVRAPRQSGRYSRSFFVQLDGVALSYMTAPTREQMKGVSVVTVSNDVPYARRLEVALDKKGNPFVKQVEPHIVERAAIAVRQKWQGLADLEFTYIDIAGGYVGKGRLKHYKLRRNYGKGGRVTLSERTGRENKGRRIVRYPAVEIRKAA